MKCKPTSVTDYAERQKLENTSDNIIQTEYFFVR